MIHSLAQTQCNNPNPPAGLFCDPDVIDGAPLLCELDCLDGYTAMMPPYDDMASQDDQPSPLCDSMNGGQPNNMSWFAFIAGSETIRFQITPFDCAGGQSADGIQAGIYGDCEGMDKLYCESEAQDNTFEIGGPGFVMGRVYYFFIDGFEGSQCMYTVNVLEGEQPFPLPDFQFSSDEYTQGEILCTGGSITTKVVGLGDEEVSYEYTIDPPTPTYPSGTHPVTNDSIAIWTFPETGDFEVCVTITNGCDVSSKTCMTVTTDRLQNESFNDVVICLEDLNSYMGPQSGDPNGDGIIGWQGNTSFVPGINTDTITTTEGCTYIQNVSIEVINPGSRDQISLFTCAGEFPVTYEGLSFDEAVTGINLSLDDRSTLGCDSLVELSIFEINIEGEIVIEQCENSEAVLNFVITDQVPMNYDSLVVYWTGTNDEILTDTNGNVSTINVDQSGTYGVNVILSIDSSHCEFSFVSGLIDFNDLRPSPPPQINWLTEPCANRNEVVYKVSRLEEMGVVYEWSYPADIANVIDNDTDSLVIDWGNSSGGNICVIVTNSCGTSDPSCNNITINNVPTANIISPSDACIGDSVEIYSDGDTTWTYLWDFGEGMVTSMESFNSPGPHIVEFNSPGIKEVSYTIIDGDCMSSLIMAEIEVLEILPSPEITCLATDNSIIFSWEEIPDAVDYEATINTGNNGYIDGNSFVVDDLMPGDIVTLNLRALSGLTCAHSSIVSASCEAGCEDIGFNISVAESQICSDSSDPVQIDVVGNIGNVDVIWDANDAVDPSGNFIPSMAEIGENSVVATVEISGCIYADSLIILVSDVPEWDYELIYPGCGNENEAIIILNPSPSSGIYTYRTEGEIILGDTLNVGFRTIVIEAENNMGCISDQTIDIPGPENHEIVINGPVTVKERQQFTLEIDYDVGIDFMLDSLIIYGTIDGVECFGLAFEDCQSLTIQSSVSQDYCLALFYDRGCTDMVCHSIQVLESIEIFAPNIFSPNEDGTNDSFILVPSNDNINVNRIRIFDRWGNLVFSKDNVSLLDQQSQWDGKISERSASAGVYLYMVEFLNEEGKMISEYGSVTLIR